jgi:hypothetical protein
MVTTYEELKHKTVAELREIASGLTHEAVRGYSQLNKEHLLPALCTALGIDTREHHQAVGIDKPAIKAQLRELRRQRDEAIDARDSESLRVIRRKMHRLKRQIRVHTV